MLIFKTGYEINLSKYSLYIFVIGISILKLFDYIRSKYLFQFFLNHYEKYYTLKIKSVPLRESLDEYRILKRDINLHYIS